MDISKFIDPNNLQADPQQVQKKIEAEIGALIVKHCIKDAIIEKLVAQLNEIPIDPMHRPVAGQNNSSATKQ